jgi:carboxymethylenebutenolidase
LRHLPPPLDLHGADDDRVPLREGQRLVAAARQLGGSAELVTYPGEGHGFDFSEDSPAATDAHRRVAAFCVDRSVAMP